MNTTASTTKSGRLSSPPRSYGRDDGGGGGGGSGRGGGGSGGGGRGGGGSRGGGANLTTTTPENVREGAPTIAQYEKAINELKMYKEAYLNNVNVLEEKNSELQELEKIIIEQRKNKKGKSMYTKDQFFFSVQKVVDKVLKEKIFPVTKFLPSGWEEYSPFVKNSICNLIIDAIGECPQDIHITSYWQDVLAPHANTIFVNLRCNLNQRLKAQYMSMYNHFIIIFYYESNSHNIIPFS